MMKASVQQDASMSAGRKGQGHAYAFEAPRAAPPPPPARRAPPECAASGEGAVSGSANQSHTRPAAAKAPYIQKVAAAPIACSSERKEAADNLETSAELLNIERSLRELSQRQARDGAAANVRHSFLSVDSGNKEYYQRSGLSVIMCRP